MQHVTKPEVFMIAQTHINEHEIERYLESIGNPDWRTSKVSHGENLIEFMGRMCYRSWQEYDAAKPDATNANVLKVRQGNKEYINNIINQEHGSVLEHCHVSFVLKDVSRVLTHELVRHRHHNYSQESLRYVRLTDGYKMWCPAVVKNNVVAFAKWQEAVEYLENVQHYMEGVFKPDEMKSFHLKKQLTSALRRLGPAGLATSIGVTGNLRAWRYELQLRSSQ